MIAVRELSGRDPGIFVRPLFAGRLNRPKFRASLLTRFIRIPHRRQLHRSVGLVQTVGCPMTSEEEEGSHTGQVMNFTVPGRMI